MTCYNTSEPLEIPPQGFMAEPHSIDAIAERAARDIYDGCWTALALNLPCAKEHIKLAISKAMGRAI